MHPPVRLVAIDVDGTLLSSFSRQISPSVARALESAQESGIVVAIATGRRMKFTVPVLAGMQLRADTPLLTSNGAVTRTLDGTLLDRNFMEARVARGLCEVLRPFGVMVFTFDRSEQPGLKEMVVEDLHTVQERITQWVEANRSDIDVVQPLEKALPDGDNPVQGMVAGSIERMREASAAVENSEWGEYCECVRTEYPVRSISVLDLLPRGVSKRTALERLTKSLGIDRRETMAIGDNWNDVEMLQWVAQGVLMGNASDELKAVAKMEGWKQAPPNDQDGVAVVLKSLVARQSVVRV